MATYTQIIYHIVFSTKYRCRELTQKAREPLFRYIWGIIKRKSSHLYRIGGTEDHIHILSSVHPSESLASFVRDIKAVSSKWMKHRNVPRGFCGWQDGYGAFTHSMSEKDRLIKYIKEQEQHHMKISFEEEFRALLIEAGVQFDDRYLL